MIQRLIPVVVLLCATVWSFGQTPQNIHISQSTEGNANFNHSAMMCDAGSISFGTFDGQSNDTNGTRKYLCKDDCLNILHDGNALIDDIQPATDAGIGYVFYDFAPTVTGPTITDIINDPATNKTDPIVVFPNTVIPQTEGIWIARDQQNGDLKITNNCNIQLAYTENRSDPIEFWFAPITVHDFATGGFEDDNGTLGCVDVSTDQAFSVVYLNAIEINAKTPILGGGTFVVRKGLPEFDGGATNYTITITNQDNPAITGTVTSDPAVDGSEVSFTVPQAGCYDILVEDGKSCAVMDVICTYLTPPVTFSLPSATVPQGSQTCITCTTEEGFTNFNGFQLGIAFDETILAYDSFSVGSDVPLSSFLIAALPFTNEPIITVTWDSPAPTSFPSGTVLFDLCFDAIGAAGDCSPLNFGALASGQLPSISIIEHTFDESFIIFNDGEICIESTELIVTFPEITPQCTSTSNNGGFEISVAQGNPSYNVVWQDCDGGIVFGPQTITTDGGSASISGLQAGDYCITVNDSSTTGGTLTYTGTITIPEVNLGADVDQITTGCFGEPNAEAVVEVLVGGVPVANPDTTQFNFEWMLANGDIVGTNNDTISGLTGGVFIECFVTDLLTGCQAEASATLGQSPELLLDNAALINPECPGGTTGQITIMMSGGNPPYSYAWSEVNSTDNPVLFGVGAGVYTVTVTDANGCAPFEESFTLVDPTAITATLSNIQDVSCFDAVLCDGSVTATGSGGNGGPYTFIWSNGTVEMDVMSSTVNNLCQGIDSVAISEGNCGINITYTIASPDSMSLAIDGTATYPVSCFGSVDGQIKVEATGGTPNYEYSWDVNGGTQSDTLSGLAPGIYTVTVEDARGCTINVPLVVGEPDPLDVFIDEAITTPTVECAGEENGVMAVYWTGGNPGEPTTYAWSPNVSEFSTATGLAAGSYTVTVTDSKGCTNQITAMIGEPDEIFADIPQPEQPVCAGDRTTLVIDSATGGSGGPYTFSINNGVPGSIANTVDLLAGEYLVSVFDSLQCSYEQTIVIQDPPPLIVDLGDDITIELGESETLNATVFGPNPIDLALWSPDVNCMDSLVSCLDPLVAPTDTEEYTLTVVDTSGCIAEDQIIVEVDVNRNVYIPNVFSPDSDGINDFFSPLIGSGVMNVKSMRIFDRWGELVFQKENFSPSDSGLDGWNGQFRGKTVSTGVYVYLIEVEFIDGIELLYRGSVLALY